MEKNIMDDQLFLDAMISEFQIEDLNVLYAQIRKDGKVTGEYKRTPNKTRLNLFSVSKSVVSCGAGIAIDEGLISKDEYICDEFKEYVPKNASENLLGIKVENLLTMTSGLKTSLFFADNSERYTVKDWIAHFFNAEFDAKAGEKFLYSNFNTYILSCMIERRAGVNFLNYMRDRFFEPLGVGNPDWTLCPKGHVHAANGLYFNIDELGNFGQMLLDNGKFNGIQLVPEEYLKEAVKKQVESVPVLGLDNPEEKNGYGYQFWMTHIPDTYLCYGNYGQFCLVMPKKNTVISIQSFESNASHMRDILLEFAEDI